MIQDSLLGEESVKVKHFLEVENIWKEEIMWEYKSNLKDKIYCGFSAFHFFILILPNQHPSFFPADSGGQKLRKP